jgi:hypothetical protein
MNIHFLVHAQRQNRSADKHELLIFVRKKLNMNALRFSTLHLAIIGDKCMVTKLLVDIA